MSTITAKDASECLTWELIVSAIEDGHKNHPRAKVEDTLTDFGGGRSRLVRVGTIPGVGKCVKTVDVNKNNKPPRPTVEGKVDLYDKDEKRICGLEAPLVTDWKTSSDSVLGAKKLANPNPKIHLVIGAGQVATNVIDAYAAIFPSITTFLIWNRTKDKARALAQSKQKQHPRKSFEVISDEDLATVCGRADIISTTTSSNTPVLKGDWVKPGTHVDLIGAFTPQMREADDGLMEKAKDSIFVSYRDTAFGDIGEIDVPVEKGIINADDIRDLYSLCNEEGIGRNSPSDITVYKNSGGGHLDLMVSRKIYDITSSGSSSIVA